ncbi:MAG: GNAT family N-acetyltransferase [Alphaproteobacteria bacterium]|nr:GNAT family N-acetyltransferase [Alphaproteobacteria bacterium]
MQTRPARTTDEAALAALLEEHERHYDNPLPEGAGRPGAALLVSGRAGGPFCLVAEYAGGLAGFAILNPFFPAANLSEGLFLKELYVAARARDQGVGEKLMAAIGAFARERGYSRVIWTTGTANRDAQRFYDRLGMRREDKVYYVMDGWA